MLEQNQATLTQWVNLYADDLYAWAAMKIGDKEAAKDLLQDTYLSALKGMGTFEGRSSPKTWLFRILNNKIVDYFRQQQKTATQPLETDDTRQAIALTDNLFAEDGHWRPQPHPDRWMASSTAHLLDTPEFVQALQACMGRLPDKWRYVLHNKYLSEQSADQICQECGLTKSNYWQILHRAKLTMKVCLDKHWFHVQ
jgi:RNA polymerase sigma-70 factor (ECF subfamily)